MLIWFNGQFIKKDQFRFLFDAEVLRYGMGFFTSTRISESVPLWADKHIQRLNDSLNDFSMAELPINELRKGIFNWPLLNGISEGHMRIMVWEYQGSAQAYIEGSNFKEPGQADKLILGISRYRRHSREPLLKYKSFNYWHNILVYREAQAKGYYDAILLNEKEEVCETSRCNVFWVKNNVLFTPAVECGLLPGIARQMFIQAAHKNGIKVQEGHFTMDNLYEADAAFLSNSVRGIISVYGVEESHNYTNYSEALKGIIAEMKL